MYNHALKRVVEAEREANAKHPKGFEIWRYWVLLNMCVEGLEDVDTSSHKSTYMCVYNI